MTGDDSKVRDAERVVLRCAVMFVHALDPSNVKFWPDLRLKDALQLLRAAVATLLDERQAYRGATDTDGTAA